MPITDMRPMPSECVPALVNKRYARLHAILAIDLAVGTLLCVLIALLTVTGCGSGGYAGGSIEAMSTTALTIDAGQSYKFTTELEGSPTVTYSLSGATCGTGSPCGSMSNTTGTTVVYTAPTGITAQTLVTLTAAVTGTQSASTVAVTVDPDPNLAGTLPAGTVGVAYSANLNSKWRHSTSYAEHLHRIASARFDLRRNNRSHYRHADDGRHLQLQCAAYGFERSSLCPDHAGDHRRFAPPVATSHDISGNPPSGLVGTAYSTAFAASGGTAPYTFSLLSGTLPLGLPSRPRVSSRVRPPRRAYRSSRYKRRTA